MGHLINPISNRLGINSTWNSNWSLINNFNYVNVFQKDYLLFQFLNWFTRKYKFAKFNILISHYKVFRQYKSIFINFYYYDADLEEKKHRYNLKDILKLLNKKKYEKNVTKKFFYKKNFLNYKLNYVSNRFSKHKRFLKKLVRTKIKTHYHYKKFFFSRRVKKMYIYLIKVFIFSLYWFLLDNFLNFYIKKFSLNNDKFYFNIFSFDFFNVTPNTISRYIALRLQQRYSLNWVLKPVLKDLTKKTKKKFFLGYKILCSGKFTRKQIATFSWTKKGSLRLNSFANLVKYSESTIRLKYGLCGIKVWINYGSNELKYRNRSIMLLYPTYSPFKYSINIKDKKIMFSLNFWFCIYVRLAFLKSKMYDFYKLIIFLKTKILIKYLIKKIFKSFVKSKFSLKYIDDNKLVLSFAKKNFSYFKFLKP